MTTPATTTPATTSGTNPHGLSEREQRLRRRRSNALGVALALLAVLFFLVTLFKMGAQVLQRPL